jgi:hypothetical protein
MSSVDDLCRKVFGSESGQGDWARRVLRPLLYSIRQEQSSGDAGCCTATQGD